MGQSSGESYSPTGIIFCLVFSLSNLLFPAFSSPTPSNQTTPPGLKNATAPESHLDLSEYDDNDDVVDVNHKDDHTEDPPWKYHGIYGPGNWSRHYSQCSSSQPRQSPIDIDTSKTKLDESLGEIHLIIDDKLKKNATVVNNGHSVNVIFSNTIRLTGGQLGDTYKVAGVHFHWGESDLEGSEHTINSEHFVLEMHIVSYDEERFSEMSAAVNGKDSLAVLGVLFKLSPENNTMLDPVISHLKFVQNPGIPTTIPYFNLESLLPPGYKKRFYRYLGSLTTPPCAESVIWTVVNEYSTISHSQLAQFRQLLEVKESDGSQHKLNQNWRPTQPLQKRVVSQSYSNIRQFGDSGDGISADAKTSGTVDRYEHISLNYIFSIAILICKLLNVM